MSSGGCRGHYDYLQLSGDQGSVEPGRVPQRGQASISSNKMSSGCKPPLLFRLANKEKNSSKYILFP